MLPNVSSQVTAVTGDSVTLTAIILGGTPTFYLWRMWPSGGSAWSDLTNGGLYSGATTASLSIKADPSISGAFYFCYVSYRYSTPNANGGTTICHLPRSGR